MAERIIFHVDANSAFLSWSAAYRKLILQEEKDLREVPSVVAGDIVNYTVSGTRRVEVRVQAVYSESSQKVIDALVQAGTVDKVLVDPAPMAVVTAYGDSAISYSLRLWVKTPDYWDVYFQVNQRVKDIFDAQGIEMTYPHLNVHIDR